MHTGCSGVINNQVYLKYCNKSMILFSSFYRQWVDCTASASLHLMCQQTCTGMKMHGFIAKGTFHIFTNMTHTPITAALERKKNNSHVQQHSNLCKNSLHSQMHHSSKSYLFGHRLDEVLMTAEPSVKVCGECILIKAKHHAKRLFPVSTQSQLFILAHLGAVKMQFYFINTNLITVWLPWIYD